MKIKISQLATQYQRSRSAFTLVEILLVVTIIGILAALVIPRIAGTGGTGAGYRRAGRHHGGIKSALGQYEVDNGFYPKTLTGFYSAARQRQELAWPLF